MHTVNVESECVDETSSFNENNESIENVFFNYVELKSCNDEGSTEITHLLTGSVFKDYDKNEIKLVPHLKGSAQYPIFKKYSFSCLGYSEQRKCTWKA